MDTVFNNRLRQILLLALIILLAAILLKQIYQFMPGFLGALTLYILQREYYFHLVTVRKWNKTGTALLFVGASFLLVAIPVYFSLQLISEKISAIANNPAGLITKAKIIGSHLEAATGIRIFTDQNLNTLQSKAGTIIPIILNSSANIISNIAIMFFLQYFFLKSGRDTEKKIGTLIPLKKENVRLLSRETKNMITANAIGIPVLACIQGIIAYVGYLIFGVQDALLWGLITGVCSMIPVVGTAVIWVPLVAYFFATGNASNGLGLLFYAVILITNIDYVARLTILKKFMDVHPLITVFGVIIGISLFGFWGVIFGPLLISYFLILIKIYINEFGKPV